MYYAIYTPFVSLYQSNNAHRTYDAAITKERAHKKKLKEAEDAAAEWSMISNTHSCNSYLIRLTIHF